MSYKYRFTSRPASSFTCPMENFVAFHEEIEYRGFGIVEYSKELEMDKAKHFDLSPMFLEERYNGKYVNFYDDLIAEVKVNISQKSGKAFIKLIYEDEVYDEMIWYTFVERLNSNRYKMQESEEIA